VFPLAFAAVVGRTVKAYTGWRLERGETLGRLDILAGSATLVSTVMSQLSLRMFSFLGPIMTTIWALSPLSGQAALRVFSLVNVTSSADVSYVYPKDSHNSVYGTGGLFMTGTSATELGMAQALYASSIMGTESVKQSSVDLWINVKIPYVELMEHNVSQSLDADGWYSLPDASYETASLVGILIFDLPRTAHNSSFSIGALYWYLQCPTTMDQYADVLPNSTSDGWEGHKGESSISLYSNNTEYRGDYRNASFPSDLPKRLILFTGYPVAAFCQISTTYVDAELNCESLLCRCVRIRRSTEQHMPANWTFLDLNFGLGSSLTIFGNFARWFSGLVPGHDSKPTIVEGYLSDPGQPMTPRSNVAISDLSNEVFSLRLAQILNTAWTASWAYAFTGLTEGSQVKPEAILAVMGVQTTSIARIKTNYIWLSLSLLASFVMLGAALSCAAFRMLQRGPDLDLLFSTMVKDNPHVSLPAMSSTLQAVERARRCKDTRIIWNDVCPDKEIGDFGLRDAAGSNSIGSQKYRLYD
jgi:hypothetical protein